MNLTYFDKLVYYQICDFMYDEFVFQKNKKTSYATFSNMCGVISQKIKVGADFNKNEIVIMGRLINRLISFFGFNNEEAVNYIYGCFNGDVWTKYQSSVAEINIYFKESKTFNIKQN